MGKDLFSITQMQAELVDAERVSLFPVAKNLE